MMEVDNIKNEAILRDILQKWKVECRADGLVPMRFVIFPHVSEVLRLPRKSEARSYEVLHMSHKIIFPKLKSEAVFCTFLLRTVLRATTPCTFWTSHLPKVLPCWCVLYVFISTHASRHNGVHFFQHLNFQKCSEPEFFCAFWFRNVLRAAEACNFSSLISPDGSAPAALASLLFDPPEPQTLGKTQCFATLLPFRAPASSVFWLFLFSDLLSSSLLLSDSSHLPFHLSILSEVWLLNFPSNRYIIDLHETFAYLDLPSSSAIFIRSYQFSAIFIYLHLFSSIPIYPELSSSFFIYFHLFSFCWQPENCSYRTGSFFPQSFLSRGVAVVWDGFRHSKWLRLGDGLLHFAETCQGYRDENHRRSAAATDKKLGTGLRLHDASQDPRLGLPSNTGRDAWEYRYIDMEYVTFSIQRHSLLGPDLGICWSKQGLIAAVLNTLVQELQELQD